MPAQEKSAGIVVFREDRKRLYLLLDYGKHWDYPKGHLEAKETPLDAARRELKEETGIDEVQIIPGFARQITYFFREKKKGVVRKTVVFYLGRTSVTEIKLSEEHVGFAYLPYAEARQRLTFPSARQVLDEAEKFLEGGKIITA
ncbi:MAG TPA: NUDIX domain-containing protein [Tepidisphaeraceae bacterium]|nr:NUDIX domain-containing protein [Tepidisphaeraceae bacterium]